MHLVTTLRTQEKKSVPTLIAAFFSCDGSRDLICVFCGNQIRKKITMYLSDKVSRLYHKSFDS